MVLVAIILVQSVPLRFEGNYSVKLVEWRVWTSQEHLSQYLLGREDDQNAFLEEMCVSPEFTCTPRSRMRLTASVDDAIWAALTG